MGIINRKRELQRHQSRSLHVPMITRLLSLPLQLLALAAAVALHACSAQAQQSPGDNAHISSESDLLRADIDATSFSATQLHEDKDFS